MNTKRNDCAQAIRQLEKLLLGLDAALAHLEIGTPQTHRRYLSR